MLRDSVQWILPTKILTDTNYSQVLQAVMIAGYGDSIIVRTLDTSEYVLPKLHTH